MAKGAKKTRAAGKARPRTSTAADGWAGLNARQRTYLAAIYATDQEQEAYECGKWTHGGTPRPASEWRWIFYGIFPLSGHTSAAA